MKRNLLIIIAILIWAATIRIYHLSEIPPSLSWDEASIGYDAWALGIDGKDQWGKSFPYIFQSFGEYKYPIHIYATALFIKLFGLSDFIVRLPSALMGILNVLLFFFLVRKLTEGNNFVAISAALFLSISPWHIQFSRVNWETNFALFFFFLGLLLFLYSFSRRYLLIFSYCLFGLAVYTYNAAKIFIPIFVILLTFLYFKSLKNKKYLMIALIIFTIILLGNVLNPTLSGRSRLQQINITVEQISSTKIFQLTKNRYLGRLEIIFNQYLSHFSPQFLFISGDKNPRHSIQSFGELIWFDALFIPLGLVYIFKLKKKWSFLTLIWLSIATLPGALVREAPHASRAMFSLGVWQIISAVGLYNLHKLFFRSFFWPLCLILILIPTSFYIKSYFSYYPISYSQDWQYGYKKIFTDYNEFDKYDWVIISDQYGQPYIFALYYLKYLPSKFRSEVVYNPIDQWGSSTVKSFNKFIFNKVKFDNLPRGKLLIFASFSEKLDGILENAVIKNLDGTVAFYVYDYNKP